MPTFYFTIQASRPAPITLMNGYVEGADEAEAKGQALFLRDYLLSLDKTKRLGVRTSEDLTVSVKPFDLSVELDRTRRLLSRADEAAQLRLIAEVQNLCIRVGNVLVPTVNALRFLRPN
jgi:hypothetical protein